MSQKDYEGNIYEISDKYSFNDFTGQNLSANEDMDGLAIFGSCFSNECPDCEIFPKSLTGTTFIKCNLSNIKVPDGNTCIDCRQTRFKVQNDLRDWEIDENGQPVKVLIYGSGGGGGGGGGMAVNNERNGGGGGGGGAHQEKIFNAGDLAGTVSVTIAAGGTGGNGGTGGSGSNGTDGTVSSFGTHLKAGGGTNVGGRGGDGGDGYCVVISW